MKQLGDERMKSNILKKEIQRDHYPQYDCRWSVDAAACAETWWLMWRKDYEMSRWINDDYPGIRRRGVLLITDSGVGDERKIYDKKIDQIDFDLLDIGNG